MKYFIGKEFAWYNAIVVYMEFIMSGMLVKNCPNCDGEYKTYRSINKKYCSPECLDMYRKNAQYEKYKTNCILCDKEFLPSRPAEGAMYCSYKCRGISDRKDRVYRAGYWCVLVADHPCSTAQGYVRIHRLKMEKKIGRYLREDEVVHHIDENKGNNNIDNLQLMTISEHNRHHAIKNDLCRSRFNRAGSAC